MSSEPHDILISKFEVKATDVINLNEFYISLHDYLWHEKYAEDKNTKFPETFYFESRTQQGGREIWVWWRCEKVEHDSNFFKRRLIVDLHGVGMKEVEIVRNNTKFKANSGKVEVLVQLKLAIDFKHMFSGPIWGNILDVFYKRIYHKRIEGQKKEALKDAYKFQEFVKRQMDLTSFEHKRQFAPPLGFDDPHY
ncbi:hypothetical protein J4232_02895 [Candidatus Woesearchaeota archaeon]|nr:hypothetical protein [Candidatus Woesearchaeota archaeon]